MTLEVERARVTRVTGTSAKGTRLIGKTKTKRARTAGEAPTATVDAPQAGGCGAGKVTQELRKTERMRASIAREGTRCGKTKRKGAPTKRGRCKAAGNRINQEIK